MAKIQVSNNIKTLDRVDLYEENEISRIVSAQASRSAQSFPSAKFEEVEEASGQNIYVYAFTSPNKFAVSNLASLANVKEAKLLGSAEFYDDYTGKNPFVGYKPNLEGSIKLTLEKKSS